jgi:hypothetical protein
VRKLCSVRLVPRGGNLKLTRTQTAKLKQLETPRIAGEGTCPVQPGFVLEVTVGLTLTVDKVRVPKGGGWSLQYTLTDTRDVVAAKAHHLRSTPPIHVEDGKPPSPQSIAQAREESSYTARADRMQAGDAPDIGWVDKHSKDRRKLWDASRAQRIKEADLDREIRRLKHLRARVRRGEDIEDAA